ncbi:hypothetical protein I3843_02G051800 [Carya illinoinensis]|nr:hypothetical protein I3843_02G051800 [Carya illinoinensis]
MERYIELMTTSRLKSAVCTSSHQLNPSPKRRLKPRRCMLKRKTNKYGSACRAMLDLEEGVWQHQLEFNHLYIYIYMCVCVCVCVCAAGRCSRYKRVSFQPRDSVLELSTKGFMKSKRVSVHE